MSTVTLYAILLGWLIFMGALVWVFPLEASSGILVASLATYATHLARLSRRSTQEQS